MAERRSHSAMYLRREAARIRLRELDRQRDELLRAYAGTRRHRTNPDGQPSEPASSDSGPAASRRLPLRLN